MKIYLYKVGRNLNRAIRTCHSFGISEINLVDCDESFIKGSLFSANVHLRNTDLPDSLNTAIFEINGKTTANKIDWNKINNIIIGGENITLPKSISDISIKIPTKNSLCLTTEASLAIALNEIFINRLFKIKNCRIIDNKLIASGLPTKSDIIYLKKYYNIQDVIDLTDRDRINVGNICKKLNVNYNKLSVNEYNPDIDAIMMALSIIHNSKSCLLFCYKGIHRTGTILNLYNGTKINKNDFKNHQSLLNIIENGF